MNWQDTALVAAGAIGAVVALIHGYLMQKLMVRPIDGLLAANPKAATTRRLTPVLLHFSTAAWFLGGLALAASVRFSPDARLAAEIAVGAMYLYGVVGNFWATRGRHPGWMLLTASLGLIAFAAYPAAG